MTKWFAESFGEHTHADRLHTVGYGLENVLRKLQFSRLQKAVQIFRSELNLDYRRIFDSLTKGNIPQELVKTVPICQRGLFSFPLAAGEPVGISKHSWSPGLLSITRTYYTFQSPCWHPSLPTSSPVLNSLQPRGFL